MKRGPKLNLIKKIGESLCVCGGGGGGGGSLVREF